MKPCPYCAESIQDSAVKCRFCGEFLRDEGAPGMPAARPPAPSPASSPGGGNVFGWIIALVGFAGLMWAMQMDVSVFVPGKDIGMGIHVPDQRVNNIGLMDQRRNYMTLGGVVMVAGVLIGLLAPRSSSPAAEVSHQREPAPRRSPEEEAARAKRLEREEAANRRSSMKGCGYTSLIFGAVAAMLAFGAGSTGNGILFIALALVGMLGAMVGDQIKVPPAE